jgi:hypothetical protein
MWVDARFVRAANLRPPYKRSASKNETVIAVERLKGNEASNVLARHINPTNGEDATCILPLL